LGVTGILAGRLRQTDEYLEVFAELTDGRDGNVIWSKDYIERLSSTQEIVAKIARAVMENLRPRLGRAELNRLDCLALYSKGRDEWNRRNPASLRIAIQYFEEATRRDPRYAPAHIGLADCYNMLGIYGEDPPSEVFPKAKKAAEAALNVDDSLSEAHTSLAFTFERHDFNRAAAQQEYELAIKLSSSKAAQATAYHRYGVYLIGLGKFSESIEKIKLAQDLDPFSQIIMADLAQPYLYSGNYEEAIRICDGTIKRHPSFAPAYRYRGLAFEQAGSFAKAVSDLEEAVRLSPDSPLMKGELGHALAGAGLRDKAMSILTELEEQRRTGYRSCYRIAQIYACLGDLDKAIAYLERALEESDPALWYVEVDPIFDKRIGSDLRFKELKKRLALR
jgi:tetratricopeptide (TPR) repeat protein